jgi:hypothetical protein
MDAMHKRKISYPCWESNPQRPARSPSLYRLSYSGCMEVTQIILILTLYLQIVVSITRENHTFLSTYLDKGISRLSVLWKLKVSGFHDNHRESLGSGQVAEWKHEFSELRASLSTNRKLEHKHTPSGFDLGSVPNLIDEFRFVTRNYNKNKEFYVGSVPEMKISDNTKLSAGGRNVWEGWRKLFASNISAHLIGSKFTYFG